MTQKLIVLLVLVALGGGGAYFYVNKRAKSSSELRLRTGKVETNQVIEGVAASGAVQPFLLVQVGTQVSGVVERLYKDWNDKVQAGEVVALIDSRRFLAAVAGDLASLGQAKANVIQTQAKLTQAERDLVRQRSLAEKKLVAESDLDAAVALADATRAQLDVTAAVVSQALAQLDSDEINLRYCTIISPIAGVIVSRNVDVGQTVAASFSTPTLFQIANDLKKVQVQAQVPEADVGKIKVGQRTPFKVDAYSENQFEGLVSQIRLASTTVQNVVTYTIMIDAENPRELLLPGMTANVTFEVAKSEKDSLTVPVAAMRFKPPEELVEGGAEPEKAAVEASAPSGDPEKPAGEKGHGEHGNGDRGQRASGEHGAGNGEHKPGGQGKRRGTNVAKIYIKSGTTKVKAVRVRVGISDGVHTVVTPITEGELVEGADVVLGILAEEEEAATNPFAPKMPGGRR